MLLPLALLALPLAVAGASSQAARISKFQDIARRNGGVVPLTTATFDELLEAPRNYSVSVLLTAMGAQYNCQPCHQFDPEHALVARQWFKQPERDQHFFAVLDFAKGPEVFQRMGLTSAPNFRLYRPTEGPRASLKNEGETLDFSRLGFRAEALVHYMKGTGDIPLRFLRPVEKEKLFALGGMIGLVVLLAIYAWPYLKIVLSLPTLWASITIYPILLLTSGYMWNQIRRPNYVQVGQGGQVSYIQGGYSSQLGAETHIVSTIYAILGLSTYTLAYTIPSLRDPIRQRLAVYVWTGIVVVMFGVLMNIFTMKQGGYPFRIF